MSDKRPIGVFDSGVGVSVLREIRDLLPEENIIYCADSGNAPYGEKPQALITARSLEICHFLRDQGVKAIVIACNTATAAAAQAIRERWTDIPIIGMEPAVKPATQSSKNGVIGVLATSGTLKSVRFAALLDKFGAGIRVLTRPGVGLVEAVERGEREAVSTRALLLEHLAPLKKGGADVIVLGCTHYVFLRDQIQEIMGADVRVIDTGAAVAAHLRHMLESSNLLTDSTAAGLEQFWLSGPVSVSTTLQSLWPGAGVPGILPPSVCLSPASA